MTAPGDWADDAACHGDPRFTDPRRGDPPQLAAVCAGCPVAAPCRDYAAAHVWLGVYVAGWLAGGNQHTRPPWARNPGG